MNLALVAIIGVAVLFVVVFYKSIEIISNA
jgi:hypothetical protein